MSEMSVRRAAGKYLRELGRLVDGIPTVTSIDMRNDALTIHVEHAADPRGCFDHVQNHEPFDLLKVMVQLEHEGPAAPLRTIHQTMLDREALSQNVNAGAYAIGFADKPIDPVSQHYRDHAVALDEIDQRNTRHNARVAAQERSRARRRARRP